MLATSLTLTLFGNFALLLTEARMILSDVLTCTVPPLRVESSLLKNPIPPNFCVITRVSQLIHRPR
jgi:hypothetical protein